MFPSRGLLSHKLHGFKTFWKSSILSVYVFCSEKISVCSLVLEMVSWLSELWAKSKNSTELQGSNLGFSSFKYPSLGLTTGAEMVLLQSETSIPSLSFFSGMVVMLDVEREWVNLEQSEYQSFLKAQQRKQYLLLGELNFLHSVHCHSSYKKRLSEAIKTMVEKMLRQVCAHCPYNNKIKIITLKDGLNSHFTVSKHPILVVQHFIVTKKKKSLQEQPICS